MLIASRRKNESLVINDDITVTVIEIRQDTVRLAVVAPRDARVHRQEVFDVIREQPADYALKSAPVLAEPPPAPLANAREAWLDRVAAALQIRTGVAVSRCLLEQALLDAAVQELGADPAG